MTIAFCMLWCYLTSEVHYICPDPVVLSLPDKLIEHTVKRELTLLFYICTRTVLSVLHVYLIKWADLKPFEMPSNVPVLFKIVTNFAWLYTTIKRRFQVTIYYFCKYPVPCSMRKVCCPDRENLAEMYVIFLTSHNLRQNLTLPRTLLEVALLMSQSGCQGHIFAHDSKYHQNLYWLFFRNRHLTFILQNHIQTPFQSGEFWKFRHHRHSRHVSS